MNAQTRSNARPLALAFTVAILAAGSARGATMSHTYPKGWNVVSVPLQTFQAPMAVFNEVSPLVFYEYNIGNGHYAAPSEGIPFVNVGQGYWLHLNQDTLVSATGNLVSTTTTFQQSLPAGWVFIGSPWTGPVAWGDGRVSMKVGTTTKVLSEAVSAGWIEPGLHAYDPATAQWISAGPNLGASMQPWVGYKVFAKVTGTLLLSPPPPDGTFPDVDIIIPVEDFYLSDADEIRIPTQVIGVAADDNLVEWKLDLIHAETGFAQTIATDDTSVPRPGAPLGTLDPTLLLNGVATLRLTAVDIAGNTATAERDIAIGGDNKLGNFRLTFIDLDVPFAGVPISVRRTYDTRRRDLFLDFGWGWQLEVFAPGKFLRNRAPGSGWDAAIGQTCSVTPAVPHVIEVRFSDREFYRFSLTLEEVTSSGQECTARGKFTQTGGLPGATLEDAEYVGDRPLLVTSGSGDLFDIEDELYDPIGVVLTTRDGRKFHVSRSAALDPDDVFRPKGLYKVEDRSGNVLELIQSGQNIEARWSNASVQGALESIQILRDAAGRVTKLVDPEGKEIPYGYDLAGNLVSVKDRTLNETTFQYHPGGHFLASITDALNHKPIQPFFDADGRLVEWRDADGNPTTFATDVANNRITVTNRETEASTYVYGTDGFLKDAIQPGGLIKTSYTYNVRGDVLTETDPLGNVTTYAYEETLEATKGNLRFVTDPENNVTEYRYLDPQNPDKVTDVVLPEGNGSRTEYHPVTGNVTAEFDGLGRVKRMTYNLLGKVESETLFYDPAVGTTDEPTRYEYDSFGNLKKRTDALGHKVEYTYDGNNRQKTETVWRTKTPHVTGSTAQPETTLMIYDDQGRLRYRTDPTGATTETRYDAAGRVQFEIDALQRVTQMVYDDRNNLVQRIDPDGRFEEYGYDLEGRRTAVFDRHQSPLTHATHFTYDDLGRLVETEYFEDSGSSFERVEYYDNGWVKKRFDPRSTPTLEISTLMEYDRAGRLRFTTDPFGKVTENRYDRNGRLVKVIDANLHETSFEYDLANRRKKTVFHDSTFTETGYDPAGRAVTQRDQNGKVTTYGFDAVGRLTSVTTPMAGHTWVYGYDEAGNHITQTDANNHSTRMTYDPVGRMLTRTLPLGQTWEYAYLPTGERRRKTDAKAVVTDYRYDNLGRLTDVDYPPNESQPSGSSNTADVHYTYTHTGRKETMTDGVGVTTYAYDARERLKSITDPFNRTISYGYDLAGNRRTVTVPSGTTTYTFDKLNRMETVQGPGDATPFVYSYDAVGFKRSLLYPNGVVTTYTSDVLNRLKKIEHKQSAAAGGNVLASFDYTLDAVGNRTHVVEHDLREVTWGYDDEYKLTSETANGPNPLVVTFQYDNVGNRLKRIDNGITQPPTQDIVYDANDQIDTLNGVGFDFDGNGNQLGDPLQGHMYAWDVEDRLLSAVGGGHTLANSFDGAGMRLQSVNDGVTTQYGMDPNTAYYRVLEERAGGGALNVAYTYGDSLLKQTTGPSFYHGDAIGSTRLLSDSVQVATDRYSYEAFGSMLAGVGTTPNTYFFAGQERHPPSGLYNLRRRYYHPQQARFVTTDPIDPRLPGAPMTLYAYAGNSPIMAVDPGGMELVPVVYSSEPLAFTPEEIIEKARGQIIMNTSLRAWFNAQLIRRGQTLAELLYPSTLQVEVGIYDRGMTLMDFMGQTRWDGCTTNKWPGQPNQTVGIADSLLQRHWWNTDEDDKQNAAETLIHELAHWVECNANRTFTPPPAGYSDIGYYVVDMVAWY